MAREHNRKDTVSVEIETLRGDVQKLADDLKEMLHNLGSQSKEKLMENKKRLDAAIKGFRGDAKERFDELYECFREHGQETLDKSRKQIEERPFAAVGVALGIGILLGTLIRRR
jgi:ElaB/YqjD/DUF883 family membrane-anchored ribosome-binding protein